MSKIRLAFASLLALASLAALFFAGSAFSQNLTITPNLTALSAYSGASPFIGQTYVTGNGIYVWLFTCPMTTDGFYLVPANNVAVGCWENTSAAAFIPQDYGSLGIGGAALASYTGAGGEEVCVGQRACEWVTTGDAATAVGRDSMGARNCGASGCVGGTPLTGNANIAFGAAAGTNVQGAATQNSFIGTDSGYYITTGTDNTLVGFRAGSGFGSGGAAITGSFNTAIGMDAGYALTGAQQYATFVGFAAGEDEVESNVTFIGGLSGEFATTAANMVCVGADTCQGTSGSPLTGAGSTVVGANAGVGMAGSVAFETILGYNAGAAITGSNNTMIGASAGANVTSSGGDVFVGYLAGYNATALTGSGNTAVGDDAGSGLQGGAQNNSIFGFLSGSSVTTGQQNTIFGRTVASTTLTTGSNNVLIGVSSATDTPAAATSNYVDIDNVYEGYAAAPTVTSGLGTSPAVTGTGTAAFEITVGSTGTPSTTEVLAFSAAKNGWVCSAQDITTAGTARESAYTTTSVTITWLVAPLNSDQIVHQCGAF